MCEAYMGMTPRDVEALTPEQIWIMTAPHEELGISEDGTGKKRMSLQEAGASGVDLSQIVKGGSKLRQILAKRRHGHPQGKDAAMEERHRRRERRKQEILEQRRRAAQQVAQN